MLASLVLIAFLTRLTRVTYPRIRIYVRSLTGTIQKRLLGLSIHCGFRRRSPFNFRRRERCQAPSAVAAAACSRRRRGPCCRDSVLPEFVRSISRESARSGDLGVGSRRRRRPPRRSAPLRRRRCGWRPAPRPGTWSDAVTTPTQRSSIVRSLSRPRMLTTQAVSSSPIRPPATSPAIASPGARPANNRLTPSATPSPKPAPNTIISRVSRRRDPSGGGANAGGGERGRRLGRGEAEFCRHVGQVLRDARLDFVDHLVDAGSGRRFRSRATCASSSTTRPPAVRSAPRCSGCGRSTTAEREPAGAGCAARWCARTSTPGAPEGRIPVASAVPSPAPDGPRPRRRLSYREITGCSRDSQARNLFRRLTSGSARRDSNWSTRSSMFGSPRSGAAATPTHGTSR